MNKNKILKQADKYANKNWSVVDNPNEHDNAREDFAFGALWAVKNSTASSKGVINNAWYGIFPIGIMVGILIGLLIAQI